MIEIQDIFNQFGDEYRKNHKLPLHIQKTMISIEACRTAEVADIKSILYYKNIIIL